MVVADTRKVYLVEPGGGSSCYSYVLVLLTFGFDPLMAVKLHWPSIFSLLGGVYLANGREGQMFTLVLYFRGYV